MRHPSDSPSWKVIDHRWPDFAAEPRNLRLAISADGINPHSSLQQTKDGLNSLDLMDMGLRCELAPRFESNRTYLPPACYTLSRKEKKVFCQTLAELKVPEGYCSNFRNLVSMEDLKLYGLKSHDYHTLMQQLLPVALRSLLPKHVRLCGPVYFRWMYPFERFMKVLKGYVRNRNHPEGCIVECYIAEEAIEFCTEYLSNVDAIGVPSSTNVDHKVGAPIPGGHITEVDSNLLLQAHHYVLENTTIIQPYIEEHMKWLKLNNPRQSKRQKWLQEEHMRTFTHWLRKKVEVAIADKEPISETLRWMAHGPTHYVPSIMAIAKDKNPVFGELCFYGIITEIWDLDYTMFRIPVFKCNWVDNKSSIKVDEFGLTLVDFTKMAHKSDPFILASQAKQVFYVQDQLDPRWSVVLSTPQRDFFKRRILMTSWIILLNTILSLPPCHKLNHLIQWMTLMSFAFEETGGLITNLLCN
ncbi:hypothetical protein CK203_046481 [Vitis vinifera]|uniref:DUF4218 domain-containing protein n=1 Tax=Vitis vinifera TaxID=29760 RepID=A0A438ILI6_VITVI|nr:hypothetical protein CK203_046481 [Vitis vinifera]